MEVSIQTVTAKLAEYQTAKGAQKGAITRWFRKHQGTIRLDVFNQLSLTQEAALEAIWN